MISLWILAILVVFAVGLGHRAVIGLRLSRYQRDRVKAEYLAKAGIHKAILELQNDAQENDYDALNESWADNQEAFAKIILDENQNEFTTISYSIKQGDQEETKFGMTDEEGRININTADRVLLKHLFMAQNLPEPDAVAIADIIFRWIDVAPDNQPGEGVFKNEPLKITEEILLILAYFYQKEGSEDYQKEGRQDSQEEAQGLFALINDAITVNGLKANINTASGNVLQAIFYSAVDALNRSDITYAHADSLISKIIDFRNTVPFEDSATILSSLRGFKTGLTTEEETIMNQAVNNFSVQSNNFRIEVKAHINQSARKFTAVVKRGTAAEIVYWQQN